MHRPMTEPRRKEGRAMLVLTRRRGEAICIGNDVKVFVAEVRGQTVRVAVEAPPDVCVDRSEVRARRQPSREAPSTCRCLEASPLAVA